MTADEQLTHFRKSREQTVGGVKGTESPSVQGPQSSEEDLVVRERVTRITERTTVREPGTNGNFVSIFQAHNDGSSSNSQEIPVSMDNVCPDRTEDQYFTYTSGEALVGNVHVRCYERIRNSP